MRYLITKNKEKTYAIEETDQDKIGTFDTLEEAEATLAFLLHEKFVSTEDTGKSYKDLTKEINEKNRKDNNKKTTREYRLKR